MEKYVEIYCKNNNAYKTYLKGVSLREIYNDLKLQLPFQVVGARVNRRMEDLNFTVFNPKDIEFIDISDPSGMHMYERTLCIILSKAVDELFPNAICRIEHPVSKGYFFRVYDLDHELTASDVEAIRQRMEEIIARKLPITGKEKQSQEVIKLFRARKQLDKVALLESINQSYSEYYELDGYVDFYNGRLLQNTGDVHLFDLFPMANGMFLRIPKRTNPVVLEDLVEQQKMFKVFEEYVEWNKIMGLSNVGNFNLMQKEDRWNSVIKIAEALHEKKIASIADQIVTSPKKIRFVLISGPSSSGKTTFSKRLAVQLMVNKMNPINISLDDYFVNRDQTPLDENGEHDFESLYALDLEFFNQQLNELVDGQKIDCPTYSFETGKRIFRGNKIKLAENDVLIIEGIHALNPDLTQHISEDTKFKIYVSALTAISLDNHNLIPSADTRLLRRIVRDSRYRNYSAKDTISRWKSVRKGEDKWIFPYQENADVMFNSSLIFEFAVMKKYAVNILEEVPQNCDEYTEANRLLKFLSYFANVFEREVPPTSLLREFFGGSSFKY